MELSTLLTTHRPQLIDTLVEGDDEKIKKLYDLALPLDVIEKLGKWFKNHREEFGEYQEWEAVGSRYDDGALTMEHLLNEFDDLTDEQKKELVKFSKYAGVITNLDDPDNDHLYVKLEKKAPPKAIEGCWNRPHLVDNSTPKGKATNFGYGILKGLHHLTLWPIAGWVYGAYRRRKKHTYDKETAVERIAKFCKKKNKEFTKEFELLNDEVQDIKEYRKILSGVNEDQLAAIVYFQDARGRLMAAKVFESGRHEIIGKPGKKRTKTPSEERWGKEIRWLLKDDNHIQDYGAIKLAKVNSADPDQPYDEFMNELENALNDPDIGDDINYKQVGIALNDGLARDAEKLDDKAPIVAYNLALRKRNLNHPAGAINASPLGFILQRVKEINDISNPDVKEEHMEQIMKLIREFEINVFKAQCEEVYDTCGLVGGELVRDKVGGIYAEEEWVGAILEPKPGGGFKIKDGYLKSIAKDKDQHKEVLDLLVKIEKEGEIRGTQALGALDYDNEEKQRKALLKDLVGSYYLDASEPVDQRCDKLLKKLEEERASYETAAKDLAGVITLRAPKPGLPGVNLPAISAADINDLDYLRDLEKRAEGIVTAIKAQLDVTLDAVKKYSNYKLAKSSYFNWTSSALATVDLMES